MSRRGDYVTEPEVVIAIATRMRSINQLQVVSYAVNENQITFLLSNGQQFRIGQIEEVKQGGLR